MPTECEVKLCQNPPHSRVVWGEKPQQRGVLCKEHIDELWQKARGLVSTGQLFWIQEPLKE